MAKPDTIFKKIGLLGSSQIKYFPLELLENEGLTPELLSCNPTRAGEIISSGKLEQVTTSIFENHIDLDAVFIFCGANDIYSGCRPIAIADDIMYIAEEIYLTGLEPIIMPIINRDKPRNMEVDEFNAIRNSINRALRDTYKKRNFRYRVLDINKLQLDKYDGVHLTNYSYRILSRAIAEQMIKLTISSLTTEGIHRLNNSEYIVQYTDL